MQNASMNRYLSSAWVKAESATQKATSTISFPNDASTFPTTSVGVGYIIQFTDKMKSHVADITLVYTKDAPVAE